MGSNAAAKVRIVGRIRGNSNKNGEFVDAIANVKPWISVYRPEPVSNPNSRSGRVRISFGSDDNSTSSNKQRYEVDECYEQDVSTEEIFNKEVKPLVSGLFGGQNSTVFAYGPRGSGKTYTIQGCEDNYGLAVLTVNAILPQAEEQGKIITVSVFEVYQDRVSDLLAANRPEVSVYDDGQGKTKLKGLSKVKVNSTSEFQRLYLRATNESLHRSHIGCIVHVVSPQTENSNTLLVGKISFIDLASYEDSRQKSSDGSNSMETTRINKSLYTVHNVLYSLNAKEARVPYRESKLTRILQDSLGARSRILMVTCMNPSFCPETIQTISLASRSCMAGFLAYLDPGKNSRSGTNIIGMSSPQVLKSASKLSKMSPKPVKPMSASASMRKQALHMSMTKAKNVIVQEKTRKLFDDANQLKKSEQASLHLASEATDDAFKHAEEKCPLSVSMDTDSSQRPLEEGHKLSRDSLDIDFSKLPSDKDVLVNENNFVQASSHAYQTPPASNFVIEDKENKGSLLIDQNSPPLSARIRELSSNLKSFCLSTEANLKMAQDNSNLLETVVQEYMAPETPKSLQIIGADDKHVIHSESEFKTPCEPSARTNERYEVSNLASPWENFHMHGSGVKESLVQEYLKFLNSASKEELKGLKGIGEKRATYILEMREDSPEPFKQLDDLKEIGLSEKQIKGMMKSVAGNLFA